MSVKGTIEYYHHIFMEEGIHAMISEITSVMKEAGNPITPERLDGFIKAVLYGADENGEANVRPPQPDMFLLGKGRVGQDLYNFQSRVWSLYVKQRNKN
jgi:hypothetical protein